MVLCTDPSYYSNTLHLHSDVEAKDMHLIVDYPIHHRDTDSDSRIAHEQEESQEWFNFPISWIGRPGFHNGGLDWSQFPDRNISVSDYRVDLLIANSNGTT